MNSLSSLPNIGKDTEAQLIAAGITTPGELRAVGAKEAWLRLLARDPSACLSRLCGLEGAVRGIRWHSLDAETKADLKTFVDRAKGNAPARGGTDGEVR